MQRFGLSVWTRFQSSGDGCQVGSDDVLVFFVQMYMLPMLPQDCINFSHVNFSGIISVGVGHRRRVACLFWEQIGGTYVDENGTHVACAYHSEEISFLSFNLSFGSTVDEGDASHLHTEI